MSDKYRIVRFYEDEEYPGGHRRIIKRGLTLEEAKEHCKDPETSSYTAKKPRGCAGDDDEIAKWHKTKSHWFDGFEKERHQIAKEIDESCKENMGLW